MSEHFDFSLYGYEQQGHNKEIICFSKRLLRFGVSERETKQKLKSNKQNEIKRMKRKNTLGVGPIYEIIIISNQYKYLQIRFQCWR